VEDPILVRHRDISHAHLLMLLLTMLQIGLLVMLEEREPVGMRLRVSKGGSR